MTAEPNSSWPDDDLIMISALQHYSYCARQYALIHLEQTFDENVYTLRGRAVHKQVDEPEHEVAQGVRVERALALWSYRLGLTGRADVVEFHGAKPYPVEYKHGPRRQREHDDLQLCAQALCLEEMTGQDVSEGAIFHHSSRRRRVVHFTPVLRQEVVQTVAAIRRINAARTLPPAVNDARCTHCSLQTACLPSVISEHARQQGARNRLFQVDQG
ncbi:MAG: CRISPR-associated protein Cas4 [Rhodospirillaceae bacterium]|nr:CRISPR-associated protein Cas4 [Rhodospirillaceae bacterium]